jgi:hypothetical protein
MPLDILSNGMMDHNPVSIDEYTGRSGAYVN